MFPVNAVTSELQAIFEYLVRLRRPVARSLRLGLTGAEITEMMGDLPLTAPPELEAMYRWRDGTFVSEGLILDDLHFFPGFYWLSLKDAITTYRAFHGDRRWANSWFPVFANGGGDFYVVSCPPVPAHSGEVIGFILGETDHPVEYQSLATMLHTIRTCFAEGVFFVSAQGHLEADDLAHARIAKRFNPDLPIYRELG